MNDLSWRPGLWIDYTTSQAIILLSDHKPPSQLTLLLDPNRSVQYVTTLPN